MFASWKIGRAAGIDLFLHPTFLLLLGLAYLLDGGLLAVLFTAAVFGCILLHEFGHALAARRFGIATLDITLYPIGGVARLESLPREPIAELLITLAGPAVNIAIASTIGLMLAIGTMLSPGAALTTVGRFAEMLLSVNLLLAVFNLLPAFPMDGGRILRASLAGWLGRLRATEIAVGVGQVLALAIPMVLLALGIFNPLHLVLAAFLFIAAGAELNQVRAESAPRLRPIAAPTFAPSDGIWTAPPGYCWVSRGEGSWGLRPIVITVTMQDPKTNHTRPEPQPWIRYRD